MEAPFMKKVSPPGAAESRLLGKIVLGPPSLMGPGELLTSKLLNLSINCFL